MNDIKTDLRIKIRDAEFTQLFNGIFFTRYVSFVDTIIYCTNFKWLDIIRCVHQKIEFKCSKCFIYLRATCLNCQYAKRQWNLRKPNSMQKRKMNDTEFFDSCLISDHRITTSPFNISIPFVSKIQSLTK